MESHIATGTLDRCSESFGPSASGISTGPHQYNAHASEAPVPRKITVRVLGNEHDGQDEVLKGRSSATMRKLGIRIAIIASLLTLVGLEARAQNSDDSAEYLIKAGFVYNFAKLVEWPPSSFVQSGHQIVIG